MLDACRYMIVGVGGKELWNFIYQVNLRIELSAPAPVSPTLRRGGLPPFLASGGC